MQYIEEIEDMELGTMQLWVLSEETVEEWNAREAVSLELINDVAK